MKLIEDTYWTVHIPVEGYESSDRTYDSMKEAEREAKRLAAMNVGLTVFVLEAKGAFVVPPHVDPIRVRVECAPSCDSGGE